MIVRPLRMLAVALVASAAFTGGVAHAHTEVQRSSPSPGSDVDGTIEQVELVFLDPVRQADITVSALDGNRVADLGPTELSDDRRVATVQFAALGDVGPKLVEYSYVAEDGAGQQGSYTFRYLGARSGDDDGGWSGVRVTGVVVLVALLGLAVGLGLATRFRPSP